MDADVDLPFHHWCCTTFDTLSPLSSSDLHCFERRFSTCLFLFASMLPVPLYFIIIPIHLREEHRRIPNLIAT